MATKISEDTNVQLDLKTIGIIIAGTISLASMWFTLQSDISELQNKIENFYELGGSPIGNSRVKLTNKEDCIKKGYVKEGENPLKIAAEQLVKDEVTILHTI